MFVFKFTKKISKLKLGFEKYFKNLIKFPPLDRYKNIHKSYIKFNQLFASRGLHCLFTTPDMWLQRVDKVDREKLLHINCNVSCKHA